MKTIGLCMIAKDESRVIANCLASAMPLIDYILVVDTGSSDGTQQIIRDFLDQHRIRGAVIDEPWRDFAYNRSFALERLREVTDIDYVLMIDADDTFVIEPGFDPLAFKAQMRHDLYDVAMVQPPIRHYRPQICSNRLPFSFKGVLHEYLEAPRAEISRETASGFAIHSGSGGARSRNPRKYQDDAEVLERALATETDPFLISRYTFYLAQSYRDCGDSKKALVNYLKRVELGHWDEEIYVSLVEAGHLMSALGRPFEEVVAIYARAARIVPGRAEALHAASLLSRQNGRNVEGMQFARRGIDLAQPAGLFIQPWIYQYGILDEFAVNAYWAGAYRESLDASLRLLASEKLPAAMVPRVAANARFAADKLPKIESPNLGRFGADDLIEQHALKPARALRSRVGTPPRVMVAILAKQKEPSLPLYLECIEALDYPKSSIVLYIRTNNNTDGTERILRDWVTRVGQRYAAVQFDAADVPEKIEQFGVHEWNATRFQVLGHIRNVSMRRALELGCEYYFVADVDNFVRRCTLRELVGLDLPIVAPLLRSIVPGQYYANYHAETDANGYYEGCDQYLWMLNRWVRGVLEVPVIHCTYLVRADVVPELTCQDASGRHEYVVFSESARKARVPQYLDNRQVYGYITFAEGDSHHLADGIARARALLETDLQACGEGTGTAAIQAVRSPALTAAPAATARRRPKTLLFCTAFATTAGDWDRRYGRWLRAVRASELQYDDILLVDDGSPILPDWPDAEMSTDNQADVTPAKLLLYHFRKHLGRNAVFDFPGWYRSFAFAGRYAHAHGYEKVIHVESDTFLIGTRVQQFVSDAVSGWTALWCPRHGFPECAIQVIAGEALQPFAELERTHPHERLIGREFELQLPFDNIEKRFIGDRYGEYLPFVPGNAEYAVQVHSDRPDQYYWWLADGEAKNSGIPARSSSETEQPKIAEALLGID
jgi:tetratricopeptide (TPR) repeat protein